MSSKRLFNIGIDIDGVICDLVKNILFIIKHKYGISLKKSDIYKHEIHEILGLSKLSFFKVFEEALISLNHPVIENAPYYINKLSKKHKITIVTSRPSKFNHFTKQWLGLNKINYHKLVNIDNEKHYKLSKFDFFIDDHLSEIILASSIDGLKLILFDQPWNKSYNIKNLFTRVKNWRDIYSLIDNYKM